MEVSLDDFRRHFEILSDEALLSTSREELVENARACYDEELSRRGLNSPAAPDVTEEEAAAAVEPPGMGDELVVLATYGVAEEASLARGLLESAGIPLLLENEYVALGGFQLRLMVPAEFEEQALEILDTQISDEELAAQAEAAGVYEEYPEEENSEKA